MKILYLDCFAGAAGDMLLAALIDLGLDHNLILDLPARLSLPGLKLSFGKVSYHGIAGLKFDLQIPPGQPHRFLNDIEGIIDRGDLTEKVKDCSKRAFQKLAQAEAKVHATTADKIHFHEVGADDAIIDIVGFFVALEDLNWPKVYTSNPILGQGTGRSAHGAIPFPGPAVLEILKDLPVRFTDTEGETVTPTGATLLATAARFETAPEMIIKGVGYGAGSRQYENRPNLLRAVLGESLSIADLDTVVLLETNIDDMNPQIYDLLFDRLYHTGALEAYLTPVIMKKSRPGHVLTVICKKSVAPAISSVIFTETTTTGIRLRDSERIILPRRMHEVITPYGAVPVKVVEFEGKIKVIPEFDICRRIAADNNIPVSEVIEAARKSFPEKG